MSGRRKVLSAPGASAIRLQVQGTRIIANGHGPYLARSLRSRRENENNMAPEWEAVVQHARSASSAASFVGPVAVLDADLRLVGASPEFHDAFGTTTDGIDTILNRLREAMLERGGDIRSLIEGRSGGEPLDTILYPDGAGQLRSLVLVPANARDDSHRPTLLVIEDVTERTLVAQRLVDRMERGELVLAEMRHRIANSLQIIASVVRIKAHLVQSEDARRHLEDVHQRVLSIAELQEQLDAAEDAGVGSVSRYLSMVCGRLASSLIDPSKKIELRVEADEISLPADTCISIGLLVTELVINALKHAFPEDAAGLIHVTFADRASGWQLRVADNGVGCDSHSAIRAAGIGSRIVTTLARRLGARLEVSRTEPHGLSVTLFHRSQDPSVSA